MAIHSRYLHNGRIRDASAPALFAGQIGLLSGWGVFSTLRVARGALFAWERHWARMVRDARLLNVAMPPGAQEVESDLLRLIEANGRPDCTLRLVVVRNTGGVWAGPHSDNRPSDVIALTADLKDWPNGVRLGIQPNGRFAANEFAGAKILSWAQNLAWAERAQESGYDEVILLNERGTVAECTSANIFAVLGDEVATPALADGCLPGITREILLEAIHVEGLRIAERSLTLDDLYRANEVLITSTTRDLLPVHEIAGRPTGGDCQARLKLLAAFGEFTRNDLALRKRATVRV
jgi:branched-chain amino acid aminotransferase